MRIGTGRLVIPQPHRPHRPPDVWLAAQQTAPVDGRPQRASAQRSPCGTPLPRLTDVLRTFAVEFHRELVRVVSEFKIGGHRLVSGCRALPGGERPWTVSRRPS